MVTLDKANIAIIGLGYVGLPLAVELGQKYKTIGFDINHKRIDELKKGTDSTREVEPEELALATKLTYTTDIDELKKTNIYIITVPTPIDDLKQPDLRPLIKASEMIGSVLNVGDVVIYESTVYPGATEEDCVPVLEKVSGLSFNKDFYVGYSPERINPSDKSRRLANILKVTSGSTPEAADLVDSLYASIITAGTHKASCIKVAEAAKVLENVQRDVNIALINEAHQIFDKLNINTLEVIEAASTKWNFMKLRPGLVGGHCIGVDPYYLLHKSQTVGYIPDLMRKAREINDGFPEYVVNRFIKTCLENDIELLKLKVLILGASFKPNCPDIRNTKVIDVLHLMQKVGLNVGIYDPVVDKAEFESEFGVSLINREEINEFDVGFICIDHSVFNTEYEEIKAKLKKQNIFRFL